LFEKQDIFRGLIQIALSKKEIKVFERIARHFERGKGPDDPDPS